MTRFCTDKLKISRIKDYMNTLHDDWINVVGLRADEPRRTAKMKDRKDVYLPMNEAGHGKIDVSAFWERQYFDLNLPNDNGKTAWGNCDLCFLKGHGIKTSIIREKPELVDWWIKQEELAGDVFCRNKPSYKMLRDNESSQSNMFDDDAIDCFCTD